MMVNRPFGEKSQQLHNRHARSDFETKTQDVGIDRGKCVPRIFEQNDFWMLDSLIKQKHGP